MSKENIMGRSVSVIENKVENLLSKLILEEKVSLCHSNSKVAIAGV
tara:strand:+ start:5836 stop:5973 length:138 start_codon:yes stop_codon:yes gene_type:complete